MTLIQRSAPSVLWLAVAILALGCASSGAPGPPSTAQTPATNSASLPSTPTSPATEAGSGESKAGSQGDAGEASEVPDESAGEAGSRSGDSEATTAEGLHSQPKGSAQSSNEDTSQGAEGRSGAGSLAGPRTADERTAEADDELRRSLEEFDGKMLREQELLEEKRAENAQASAAAGGGTGGSSSGSGSGSGSGSERSTGSRSTGSTDSGDSGGGNAGSRVHTEAEREISERDRERTPEDVGDGSDDDIVARQLREAALAEDDPELREKLWDEYRQYKRSGGDDR